MCLSNSLLNCVFPFYINNGENKEYYLYKLVSPSVNEDLIPMITLEKVGERVVNGYSSTEKNKWSSDILSTILGTRKDIENRGVDLVEKIIEKDVDDVVSGGTEFPLIEMAYTNNRQKLLIINLRDSIRWKSYKFIPGNFIDILVSPTEFLKCEIVEDGEYIYLKPSSKYKTDDPEMRFELSKTPLSKSVEELLSKKWKGTKRASDLNRDIKRVEWSAFSKI